jgi:hypothetical protein
LWSKEDIGGKMRDEGGILGRRETVWVRRYRIEDHVEERS